MNVGPTDAADPARPKSMRWIPVEEDIHGWTPFVPLHPACFAQEHGVQAMVELIDESHRRMRRIVGDP